VSEVTCDAFLSGRVRVFQPKQGFRAGTDSVLLAAALDESSPGHALDLGCGAGGAMLPALARASKMQITGLERDPEMADLARRGIVENNFSARAQIVTGNSAEIDQAWQNRFDLVFSNPPFFKSGASPDPGPGKHGAHLESVPLKRWMNAMLFALCPKGKFLMVHRAAALARILSVLDRQTGEITVLPVHSYPGSEAKRILVRARKGLRPGPLRLLEPRYLYEQKGGARTVWAIGLQEAGHGIDWN